MDTKQSTSATFYVPQSNVAGGYPQACFEPKELKPSFECKICKRVLKAPHQDDDGSRYCYKCAVDSGIDNAELDPDAAIEKQMLRGLVRCQCDRPGCNFRGDFRAFRLHYDNCEFDIVKCAQCSKEVRRNELENHMKNECVCQEVVCQFCKKKMRKANLQEHLDRECYSDKCIFGCELSGSTNMLEHHRAKHHDHLFILNQRVQQAENSESDVWKEMASLDDELLDVIFQSVREQLQYSRESESSTAEQSMSADNAAAKPSTSVVAKTSGATRLAPVIDKINQVLGESDEGEIKTLLDATSKLQESCDFMKTFITETFKEIVESEQNNQRNYREIQSLQTELDKLKFQFSSQVDASKRLETEVRHLETTTNDGLFVFRIPDWNKHLETAKSNENYSVYSTSFYTHQGGYRLRMRVFPYGEKDARGKFLSAYINVLKGPYDAILPWPFRRCIVLTCLDQRDMKVMSQQEYTSAMSQYQQAGSKGAPPSPVNDPRKDISFRLRPDPLRPDHKRAFGQPQTSENPSIGFLRFVSIEAMVDPTSAGAASRSSDDKPMYCRNDTVFLRCAIEPIEP